MSEEIWEPIPGWGDLYLASNLGRIRSLDRVSRRMSRWGKEVDHRRRGCILKQTKRPDGRMIVNLARDGEHHQIFVHRLVLMAFVGPCPSGHESRHLDGNPANNRKGNLAWGTRLENMADRYRLGEHNPARGEQSGRATLTEIKVRQIRREAANGRSYAQIAGDVGASRNAVRKAAIGQTWGWLQ